MFHNKKKSQAISKCSLLKIVIVFLTYRSTHPHPFAVPISNAQAQQEFLHISLQPLWTHLQMSEQPEGIALQELAYPNRAHSDMQLFDPVLWYELWNQIYSHVIIRSTITYVIYLLIMLDMLDRQAPVFLFETYLLSIY